MIERYTRPEMGRIWSEQTKWQRMLDVELAVCEAWHALGAIPAASLRRIKSRARFDVARIQAIEAQTKHDIIAFLTNVAEHVGPDSRYIHMGLTSNDAIDTGQALQLRDAIEILEKDIQKFISALARQARRYKHTPMAGRSHNVHAEPITLGLKMALWFEEMKRNQERLSQAKRAVCVGKLSGAVGTFSNSDMRVEARVLKRLKLGVELIANQVVQRDRHAQFLTTLAIIAATVEKIATEIRNLQHTEILEVEEYFAKGQKGSSAMPHKRNPIICERLCGLARLLRGNAMAALENVALWHERDISHSSVERVILPDATIALDYMLHLGTELIAHLVVYPDAMQRNLNITRGLMFSQRVLLALVEKGLTREAAYRIVQDNAARVWKESRPFQEVLRADPRVSDVLSPAELATCFDLRFVLRNVDALFKRIKL